MRKAEAQRADFHWIVLILSMAVSAGMAVWAGQDAGFDLLNYHYYSGFAFLHKPFGYDFAPAQIQSFHNPLMHVLSYLSLAHLSAKAAAALLGAIQGLNFYLIFLIARTLFSGLKPSFRYILAVLCAAAGFYGIASSTELGTTYGDSMISILVLAGILLIVRRLHSGRVSGNPPAAFFAAAGLLIGAAVGLKFTCAMYAVAVVLAVPLTLLRTRQILRVTGALIGGLVIGFLFTYGAWAAKLYSSFHNPVFPYLNRTFRSPYFEPGNFLDERFLPRNWQQLLFYPFFFVRKNNLVSEMDLRDIRLALCYVTVLLILGIAVVRFFSARRERHTTPDQAERKNLCLPFLVYFFLFSYAAWLRLSSIYRYLSVLELMAPLFVIYAISRFFSREAVIVALSIALCLAIFVTAIPIDFGRQEFDDALLKVEIPRIRELDRSVVLMSGYEPTAYIIPSFPLGTRFARISSTFTTPGQNPSVDARLKRILAAYDSPHTFAFVPKQDEIGMARLDASAYRIPIDARACFEIRSNGRNRGYLCAVERAAVQSNEKPAAQIGYFPQFTKEKSAIFDARPEQKYINGRFNGLKASSVDVLYEMDGELMPAIRNWPLDSSGLLHLGPFGRSGHYRITGVRNSADPQPDLWIPLDSTFNIGG